MNYSSDPFGRRRRPRSVGRPGSNAGMPTLEDYQALAQAYQQSQAALDAARKQLNETRRELEIKNEALQRQSADFKTLESELVWTRAALGSQEPRPPRPSRDERAEGDVTGNVTGEVAGEITVWRNRFLRLQAELDTLRKRWEQRFELDTAEARHAILRDMLPLADHLELALQHGQAYAEANAREFLANVEATLRAFLDTLRRYQVEPIDALNQPFDPEWHEAIGQVYRDDVGPQTVVQVVQTGYRAGDRLLRPARVLISQGESSSSPATTS